MRPSPLTSLRSPTSSSVVILIRSLAKSSWLKPSTTDHPPDPSEATGNPNCRPSGAPYCPVDATATEKQSPAGVFERRLTTVAIAADAAEGLQFGFPVASDGSGGWSVVEGFSHDDFATERIKITTDELLGERDDVKGLGLIG